VAIKPLTRRLTVPRKRRHEDDKELRDDDEMSEKDVEKEKDDEEDEEDDEETIGLDKAEEEEDDDDDDDDEGEKGFVEETVEDIERRRLFQTEAEDILENLTQADYVEVLKENEMDAKLAPKLKKVLAEVIREGEMDDMEEAWDEAIERLEES
jgi:hypothetical protein